MNLDSDSKSSLPSKSSQFARMAMLVVTGRFEARIVVGTDWKKEHRYFRQTGVSRHHGGPIEGPPETPWTITIVSYRGV